MAVAAHYALRAISSQVAPVSKRLEDAVVCSQAALPPLRDSVTKFHAAEAQSLAQWGVQAFLWKKGFGHTAKSAKTPLHKKCENGIFWYILVYNGIKNISSSVAPRVREGAKMV